MKKSLIAFVVSASLSSLAVEMPKLPFDPRVPPKTEAERQQRLAYIQKIKMERTGGDILRPGSLKGEIAIVDCQQSAKSVWLEESRAYLEATTKFKINKVVGSFDIKKPKVVGDATLFVVDDPSLPPLLSAPESRWAVVNVSGLKTDKEAFFRARTMKELSRGFALLCGAMGSTFPQAITRAIARPEDLDEFADNRLPMDVVARFAPFMKTFGVQPATYTLYSVACQEGWAPAPTNDAQKAIWDKAHQLPTKPLPLVKPTK